MIYQKQAFRHDPENGVIGDCHRTAVACLLNLPRDEVPHFGADFFYDRPGWDKAWSTWLLRQGYVEMTVAFDAEHTPLESALQISACSAPGAFLLFYGMSKNGVNHTVIVKDGTIVWDPAIDESGIVGPLDCGQYQYATLLPAKFKFEVGIPDGNEWATVDSRESMREFFLSRMDAIREAARALGYAIGQHGSLLRDLDLIAVPWVEDYADKDELAYAIHQAASGFGHFDKKYKWEAKPNGRVATSMPICWTGWDFNHEPYDAITNLGHLDLSVVGGQHGDI